MARVGSTNYIVPGLDINLQNKYWISTLKRESRPHQCATEPKNRVDFGSEQRVLKDFNRQVERSMKKRSSSSSNISKIRNDSKNNRSSVTTEKNTLNNKNNFDLKRTSSYCVSNHNPRRNPSSLRSRQIKLDSTTISKNTSERYSQSTTNSNRLYKNTPKTRMSDKLLDTTYISQNQLTSNLPWYQK